MGFKKFHPDTVFEIRIEDTAKITDLVLNHNLICGVVGAFSGHQKLTYQPLLEDELILVAAPGMMPNRLQTPDRLYAMPFLIREPGSGTRKIMEIFLEQAGIDAGRLQIVATVETTAAIKEALKAGLGAAILSRLAVKEELTAGKLQEVKVANMVIKRDFYVIRHTKRTLPLQYQTFIEYMQQNIKQAASR
jgi:DNA-binding transcriptional LysR family regulator